MIDIRHSHWVWAGVKKGDKGLQKSKKWKKHEEKSNHRRSSTMSRDFPKRQACTLRYHLTLHRIISVVCISQSPTLWPFSFFENFENFESNLNSVSSQRNQMSLVMKLTTILTSGHNITFRPFIRTEKLSDELECKVPFGPTYYLCRLILLM